MQVFIDSLLAGVVRLAIGFQKGIHWAVQCVENRKWFCKKNGQKWAKEIVVIGGFESFNLK